jgi:quinol-cytochrome oxidoreductase complex cytochrome b subunit
MTNTRPSELPTPGWYLDPTSGRRRWWNGIAWAHEIDGGGPGYPARFTHVSSSANVNPWPIWVLILLPLVVAIPLLTVDFTAYFREIVAAERSQGIGSIPPGYLFAQLANLAAYPAMVVLAYLDTRSLRRIGLDRPFHWAWSFLGIVYIIGRAVVLKRRVGRGTAPLWIYLLVSIGVGAYVGAVVGSAAAQAIIETLPTT